MLNELNNLLTLSLRNINSIEVIFLVCMTLFLNKIRILSSNLYYRAFTNFLGTLFHELAHFFMAVFFLKIPSSISVMPYREGNIHNYGRVTITYDKLNLYNTFPINIAPILIIPTILLNPYFVEFYFYFASSSIISKFIFLYIVIVLATNAIPSSSDLRNGFYSASFLFWLSVSCIFYFQNYVTLAEIIQFLKHGFLTLYERFFYGY